MAPGDKREGRAAAAGRQVRHFPASLPAGERRTADGAHDGGQQALKGCHMQYAAFVFGEPRQHRAIACDRLCAPGAPGPCGSRRKRQGSVDAAPPQILELSEYSGGSSAEPVAV